jgi:hypothetical protein
MHRQRLDIVGRNAAYRQALKGQSPVGLPELCVIELVDLQGPQLLVPVDPEGCELERELHNHAVKVARQSVWGKPGVFPFGEFGLLDLNGGSLTSLQERLMDIPAEVKACNIRVDPYIQKIGLQDPSFLREVMFLDKSDDGYRDRNRFYIPAKKRQFFPPPGCMVELWTRHGDVTVPVIGVRNKHKPAHAHDIYLHGTALCKLLDKFGRLAGKTAAFDEVRPKQVYLMNIK